MARVRRWAYGRGVTREAFRRVQEEALLHIVSRLLQAIYRESRIARLHCDRVGDWYLDVGSPPRLRAPASGPLPFGRLEIVGHPWRMTPRRRALRTPGAFLTALNDCIKGTIYDDAWRALRSDFENSVANVVLNRLLAQSFGRRTRALEPAYQGHQYYPFPALRIGPSLPQVLACSHLCEGSVTLPCVEVRYARLVSPVFRSFEDCTRAWAGVPLSSAVAVLPVHPWQLALSPVVRELVTRGHAVLHAHQVGAIPLASQRTCRIVRTGFDVKLPVHATLTGEHRLLYRLNCENAPAVSALAKRLRDRIAERTFDVQQDVASICFAQPDLAPHLCVIVREPVFPRPGERMVAAINMWSGPRISKAILRGAGRARIEEFFHRYAGVLMAGPVRFCSEWGMAFEPHLQNVYVAVRDGMPTRVVLRDLDNTVLDRRRVLPQFREAHLPLARGTWAAMPAFEIGGMRMVQAMLFGHLGEVMWCLSQDHGADTRRLMQIVEDNWSDLEARADSDAARCAVRKLRGWSDSVKATLRTRLQRSTVMQFVRK